MVPIRPVEMNACRHDHAADIAAFTESIRSPQDLGTHTPPVGGTTSKTDDERLAAGAAAFPDLPSCPHADDRGATVDAGTILERDAATNTKTAKLPTAFGFAAVAVLRPTTSLPLPEQFRTAVMAAQLHDPHARIVAVGAAS